MTGKRGLPIPMSEDGKKSEDLIFVYPNDIRREGFMLRHVLGVTSIEPIAVNGLQTVHTTNGDMRIGSGYVRVARHVGGEYHG